MYIYISKNEEKTSYKIQTKHKRDITSDDKRLKDQKNNKNYSKSFKCDLCDKKYTWYSVLSNHKRFVHNKGKEP
jgi:hypothetical protein